MPPRSPARNQTGPWGDHIHPPHSATLSSLGPEDGLMDLDLHPAISLSPRGFNALIAPVELLVEALNGHLSLQRFKILYVCGNYSRILSHLDRGFGELEVRRAFTVFQLMTILEESHHTLLLIEHDPLLYEDAAEMAEYVSCALKDAAKEAAVLLYSPAMDPFLEELTKGADRVFCFREELKAPRSCAKPRTRSQTTLEAF